MTTTRDGESVRIRNAVTDVVERIFDTVATLGAAALGCLEGDATGGGNPPVDVFADLRAPVAELLGTPGQVATGLGMIAAPQEHLGLPLQSRWWQVEPHSDLPVALDPDLRPSSAGYYDFSSAEWFDVPRRTGRRYVAGPHVDVHGTDRYLLTFTTPVAVDGRFLGVVGADVPVSRFENRILRDLGWLDHTFVMVNDDDRVVLSTVPHRLTGSLLPGTAEDRAAGELLRRIPWRLRVLPRPAPADRPAPTPPSTGPARGSKGHLT